MANVSSITPVASIHRNGTDPAATIAALQAQLVAMQAKLTQKQTLSLKVSEKGGLSVYGLGRFPVTLYKEQWQRLLAAKEGIEDFITANEALLKVKE